MTNSLLFGIITIQDLPWPTLVEHWKHIEALGYDSVWVGDHFLNPHAIEENWFDGWNLPPQQNVEVLRQQRDLLEEHCAKIGRDPGEIRHSSLVGVTADTPFASMQAFHDFIGRYREIGFSEFIFYYDYPAFPYDKSMDRVMVERIATEAIPAIRSKGAS
jgi:alkanesulfonate monooxygenase SsuD/methylene tetrahydromethanopterin reductase-like flavin-dependent oxidoreductase (luciferase family)